jgi:hypothetical protein
MLAGLFGLLAATTIWGQSPRWQDTPEGRWAELPVSSVGRTGFALMAPEQTDLTFTNLLDDYAAAANRVLYNGSGVAVGDYDNDGWPDLYFCGLNTPNKLFRNLGNWKFKDVTQESGIVCSGKFYRGAVFADINGDNSMDLLVATTGQGVLCFQNDGRGKFTDVTRTARTASSYGSVTLALADIDGNGTLDLYVANNRTDDLRDRGQVNLRMVNGKMAVPPELKDRLLILDGQILEYGEPDQLYVNDGKGRFTPVSWVGGRFRTEDGAPLTQVPRDWALTASFRDINGDGFPDLYVCNDFWTPDRMWLNDGKGRFRAAPRLALRNMCASSMGVDFADIDRDGYLDFFVVDMLSRNPRLRKRQKPAQIPMVSPIGTTEDRPQFMRNTLFHNRGDGTFAEIANYAGIAASEWSWQPLFIDVDLDGYEDLLITSGHAKDVQDLDAAAQIKARQHSWKGFTNEVERQKAFTRELMEHMRLYPELATSILAFRNRGDLQFDEVTSAWGTQHPGIHHAIATADIDRDGDLDFVVNNLGGAAGLYRNDTTAPRVAVRLRGLPPNTQGIGANLRLLGGAVPIQSQEIIAGGRYMSGSEPMAVFAAGTTTNSLTLEVTWRSGSQSRVTGVRPNRIYEIEEKKPVGGRQLPPARTPERRQQAPLFEDVSRVLQHRHHEEPFDDLARQPLLSWRLSQMGPGVTWFDLDQDGDEDLIIGNGVGGQLACYRNKGAGAFERISVSLFDAAVTQDQTTILGWRSPDGSILLEGSASYEGGSSKDVGVRQLGLARQSIDELAGRSGPENEANQEVYRNVSIGPLALADVEGDGDLDLFVGGRVMPGRYPEAASSRLYRYAGTQFQLDLMNSKTLENIGLVSGAVWSDLDGDGLPELILSCEWGPVKILRNEQGRLKLWNPPVRAANNSTSTMNELTGWWNGIATGDLDSDGRMDIVAANWGLNGDYLASRDRPLQLWHGDLLDRGVVDLIEAEWDPLAGAFAPRRRMDVLGRALPQLLDRFTSHRAYSEAALADVLGPLQSRARRLEAATLASTVFLNRGDRFEAVLLPREAQWAPAFGVNVADFDGDGNEDVFLSQNFFATEPETPRLDAGRGLLLRGAGSGKLEAIAGQRSGIEVYGEQRGSAVADFDADGRADLVVTQNGSATKLFHNQSGKPGLRIRLAGAPGNVDGVGAILRLKFGSKLGPAREIHAGCGYWSQDGAIQVLGMPEPATQLWVRWPGGRVFTIDLPANSRDIVVSHTGKLILP